MSGVLILLQASGWRALRVAPLLRDNDEGPQPIEQGAAFLLEIEASHSSEFEPLLGVSWRNAYTRTSYIDSKADIGTL